MPRDWSGALAANLNAQVSGADRRTLDAIFRHPLSHGLAWREVVLLFEAIGAADERHNGEFMLSVGDERLPMRRPHNKDLTAAEVMELRHFLVRAGWSPDSVAAPSPAPVSEVPWVIVVINHAGAVVCRIDPTADGRRGGRTVDPKHLLHHVERRERDKNRAETHPDDEHFFDEIAAAVSTGGGIVIIGHGKGQSNEADHLSAYLQVHHKDIHARIARILGADLPSLSLAELLELGRRAFTKDAAPGSA